MLRIVFQVVAFHHQLVNEIKVAIKKNPRELRSRKLSGRRGAASMCQTSATKI